MTAAEVVLLCFGGMSIFDSLVYAFGTAGTGGFGIYSDSAASLSPYCQWVIAIFLFFFGINFNLYYLILIGRIRSCLRSTELRVYAAMVALGTVFLCFNLSSLYQNVEELLRHSFFQVITIITTAGFSTADFALWPVFSQTVLVFLMFTGACAGSTAGGIKISRVVLFFQNCHAEFRHMLHPRSVNVLQMDGKKVDKETRMGVSVYLSVYVLVFFLTWILIAPNGFDFVTTFTAVAACFNNVGPGLGAVGPFGGFAGFSDFSKIVLSFSMLLGRLEIWPILLTLSPRAWMSKHHKKSI